MTRAAVSNRATVPILQNLLTYSEQFDNGAWTKQAGVTVTANQAADPDGTTTADLIDLTDVAVNIGFFQISVNVNGAQNTKSIWLRGVLGGEVVTLVDPATTMGVTTCNLTTTWQRFSLTEAAGAQPGNNAGLWVRKSSGNQIYAWGAQLVKANREGPYVQTVASAVNTGNIRNKATSRQTI